MKAQFMPNSQKWLGHFALVAVWGARITWVVVFIAFIIVVVASPGTPPAKPNETEVKDIKIYNQDRTRYATWERKEAIRFGFEQLASSINYLFVAAAAIIAFISKIVIEPIVGHKPAGPLSRDVLLLLRHAAFGSVLSLFYGFFGYLYFNKLPDTLDFSIYQEIGLAQLFQLFSFFSAVLLLLLAVIAISSQRMQKS